jgi:hypothetical protein
VELARTLNTLWLRRRLVAVGATIAAVAALLSVYQVSLVPPGLKSRTNVFATASTQILIDTPDSAFANVANEIEPLNTRAGVFARFLTSPEALALIAREAKLPLNGIEAQGPYDLNVPEFQRVPTAERRSSQILGEGALYRLRFENNPELPIISVFAQAPTTEEALALASAAPAALRSYIEGIQARQDTPTDRQVEVRKLGRAVGGVINESANLQIATLVFIVVLFGWCMLLVPAQTIARGWRDLGAERAARSSDNPPEQPRGNRSNGHERGGGVPRPERERVR